MQRGSPFDCALRLLTARDHSEGELRRKLGARAFDGEEIESVVERLKELGYLDDARFARGFAASAMRNGRGYGARLKLELARRGVAPGTVTEVLEELSGEFEEKELLAQLLSRRYPGFDTGTASDKEKRKVVGYLQRKGFSLSAIFRALDCREG